MKSLHFSSFSYAQKNYQDFDAILSIGDVGSKLLSLPKTFKHRCALRFSDVDTFVGDDAISLRNEVQRGLEFIDKTKDCSLLVHCQAGVARSSSMTLAASFLREPQKSLEDHAYSLAMKRLGSFSEICPNKPTLSMIDTLFQEQGLFSKDQNFSQFAPMISDPFMSHLRDDIENKVSGSSLMSLDDTAFAKEYYRSFSSKPCEVSPRTLPFGDHLKCFSRDLEIEEGKPSKRSAVFLNDRILAFFPSSSVCSAFMDFLARPPRSLTMSDALLSGAFSLKSKDGFFHDKTLKSKMSVKILGPNIYCYQNNKMIAGISTHVNAPNFLPLSPENVMFFVGKLNKACRLHDFSKDLSIEKISSSKVLER